MYQSCTAIIYWWTVPLSLCCGYWLRVRLLYISNRAIKPSLLQFSCTSLTILGFFSPQFCCIHIWSEWMQKIWQHLVVSENYAEYIRPDALIIKEIKCHTLFPFARCSATLFAYRTIYLCKLYAKDGNELWLIGIDIGRDLVIGFGILKNNVGYTAACWLQYMLLIASSSLICKFSWLLKVFLPNDFVYFHTFWLLRL